MQLLSCCACDKTEMNYRNLWIRTDRRIVSCLGEKCLHQGLLSLEKIFFCLLLAKYFLLSLKKKKKLRKKEDGKLVIMASGR